MKTIKLKETSENGYHIEKGEERIKYIQKSNDYPIEIGEHLCFKWHKPWIVLDVFSTKTNKGETE